MPMLEVSLAILLVILANKKQDWNIFNEKVLSIDLILPKSETKKRKTYHRFRLF